MTSSLRSHLVIFVLVSWVLTVATCATLKPSSTLTPQAQAAWTATQAIHAADALRDVAISANDQHLLSETSTRAVVKWHLDAINVIHAAPSGWQAVVGASLKDLDRRLAVDERARLAPYLSLVSTLVARGSL